MEAEDPEGKCLEWALRLFDRKERHFLVQNCLGDASRRPSVEFLHRVSDALPGLSAKFGLTSWWTTDYHLDWLAGALTMYYDPALEGGSYKTKSFPNSPDGHLQSRLVNGTPEDVDLLIADGSRLVMIEAKRFGRWEKLQVESKLKRLLLLKGFSDTLHAKASSRPKAEIHLLLASPGKWGAKGTPVPPQSLRDIWKALGVLAGTDRVPWIPLTPVDGDKRTGLFNADE